MMMMMMIIIIIIIIVVESSSLLSVSLTACRSHGHGPDDGGACGRVRTLMAGTSSSAPRSSSPRSTDRCALPPFS
jgi:hypothetical protein